MTPPRRIDADGPVAHALAAAQQRALRPGHRPPAGSFHGRSVLTLESRRAPELALLVVNYGGRPLVAPALREAPLEANTDALRLADSLVRHECELLILTTGIGTRLFMQLATPVHGRDTLVDALSATRILARGPKPVAALRELGISAWLTAPSPNTWREVVATLDAKAPDACAGGTRVAVQERYGATNPVLVRALEDRGACVTSVSIYRWELPEDVEPLRQAVRAIVNGAVDIVLLTASVQLVHLLRVAADMNMESITRRALGRLVVASIGPMTSEELVRHGLRADLESSHPKMGFLVKEAAERCGEVLRLKRSVA